MDWGRRGLELVLIRPAAGKAGVERGELFQTEKQNDQKRTAEAAQLASEPQGALPSALTAVGNDLLNLGGVRTKN